MQTLLLLVGKTNDSRLISLMEDYTQRINRYQRFEIQIIPEHKNKGKMTENIQKQMINFGRRDKSAVAESVVLIAPPFCNNYTESRVSHN